MSQKCDDFRKKAEEALTDDSTIGVEKGIIYAVLALIDLIDEKF